jgi:AraC-like DNA-binding protein
MTHKDLSVDATAVRQTQMIELLGRLAPQAGYTLSALDDVRFLRANAPIARAPVLYEPSIVVVCQGTKRGFLGDAVYVYDAQQFLVLSVPLPFESETVASVAEPMLAVAIRIDLAVAAELALALDASERSAAAAPVGICATPLDDKLGDAVLRLLQALASPTEARVLGAAILREIYFRVLTGVQGPALRAALTHQSHFGKIGKALRRIHAGYSDALSVEALAREAGVSVPAFHARFKAVTQTSPIQYIKTTRLHKARLLMVQDGASAQTAAARVGYESASQFSREFKRFFGRTPAEEAAQMKDVLALVPQAVPTAAERYVTVQ